MHPYIHISRFTIGTFGLLLWFAAVCAGYVLYLNFRRFRVQADAVSVVAFATVFGVIGAKVWHVLETPHLLMADPAGMLFDRAGFAWYGGLVAGVLTLMWQGRQSGTGALGMLDLASPAAAIGYGVGRIGLPGFGRWRLRYTHYAALGHELSAGPGADVSEGTSDTYL